MKALIQRVTKASVAVEGSIIGEINRGLLVLLGVDREDDEAKAQILAERMLKYRIFADDDGKMNRSVMDVNGGVLVVSQFTLSASTAKGLRPSFTSAAEPSKAEQLYRYFLSVCRDQTSQVESGRFAADMQVSLVNDGPVTFLLEV